MKLLISSRLLMWCLLTTGTVCFGQEQKKIQPEPANASQASGESRLKAPGQLCPMGLYGQVNGVYFYAGYIDPEPGGYCSYGSAESMQPKNLGGYCIPPCTEDCDFIGGESTKRFAVAIVNKGKAPHLIDTAIEDYYDGRGNAKKFNDKQILLKDPSSLVPGRGRAVSSNPHNQDPNREARSARSNFVCGSFASLESDTSYLLSDVTNETAGGKVTKRVFRCFTIRLELSQIPGLRPRDVAEMKEKGLDRLRVGMEVTPKNAQGDLENAEVNVSESDGPDQGQIQTLKLKNGQSYETRIRFAPDAQNLDKFFVVIAKPDYWK